MTQQTLDYLVKLGMHVAFMKKHRFDTAKLEKLMDTLTDQLIAETSTTTTT